MFTPAEKSYNIFVKVNEDQIKIKEIIMMTDQDRFYHAMYSDLLINERIKINSLFYTVVDEMKNQGMEVSFDDRAECLVAALARFCVESKGDKE